jgi:ATPase subunit of ABC transporter with duplicated ATPase domains
MIGITNLGKAYGARTLFEKVTLKLVRGSRYGLVGANGAGKSTLLKIMCGDEVASDGSVSIDKGAGVGVLRQDRFLDDEAIIVDLAMAGDEIVTKAMREQDALSHEEHPDAARMMELDDIIRTYNGYTLRARASGVLEGLGIPLAVHEQPLATLSGGFKLRVLLAQVLIGGPDVLLLDEPTNHLDILSIRWLEKFLAGYQGCAVVISHDQRFLDNIATHILDVDYGTITPYTGNYAKFQRQKTEVRERKEAEIARVKADIAEKRAWVERFGAKATKASQAQSRLKQIEKIDVEELENSSRRAPLFQFTPERPSGKDVLELTDVRKAYGEKRVLEGVSLVVRRQERVAIIGPNGLGKSTLLKIATGNLEADEGKVRWGHETRVGYFAQDHKDTLIDENKKAVDVVWDLIPHEGTAQVRGQLGRVLFSGPDVDKRVGLLSGGEAARLVFCCLMVQKPNVLVLDEPTNHLDLEAIDALITALKAFEGTLVFVSHDRAFVSALATRIIELKKDGFSDFPGTYDEYLAKAGDDHLDHETVVLKEKAEKVKTPSKAPSKAPSAGPELSWEEQKKEKNRKKQLPQKRDQLLKNIEQLEARKTVIDAKFCEAGFYERTLKSEIASLEKEQKEIGPRIEALMAEWEAVEAELSQS